MVVGNGPQLVLTSQSCPRACSAEVLQCAAGSHFSLRLFCTLSSEIPPSSECEHDCSHHTHPTQWQGGLAPEPAREGNAEADGGAVPGLS